MPPGLWLTGIPVIGRRQFFGHRRDLIVTD
jgi:hypothetical protein